MDWLRLNALSVGALTTTILLGVITVYLLALDRKGRETWWLTGYLGSLFVLLLSYTARYSIFSPAALATGQVANLIVFGVACLVQFAYTFSGSPFRRESRVVLALTLTAGAAVWGSLFVPGRFPAIYDFRAEYFTYEYGPRVSTFTLIEYVWALVVFSRRIFAAESGRGRGMVASLRRLLRPRSRTGLSHRNFALLTLATIPIALQYVLHQTGVISRATYSIVFNTGALLICLVIFIVYINNAPHPTSFLAKLIGVPLAVVMFAFGIASNAVMPLVERNVMDRYRAQAQLVKPALQAQDFSLLPHDVRYLLPYSSLLPALRYRTPGMGGVYPPDQTIGGQREASRDLGEAPTFQFGRLDDTSSYVVAFTAYFEGVLYCVGFSYRAYRYAVHEFAWKLSAAALLAFVIVVFGFPLLFRRGLLTPLRVLLHAVAQVTSGNFRERVQVFAEDEVGQLARGYNRMVEALRTMEGNFQALTENAYDAILILSMTGEVLFANGRALELSGYPRLEGKNVRELVPAEEAPALAERLSARLSARRAAASFQTYAARADGGAVPVEITAAATRWQGAPAVVVVVRDVSERKQAEDRLRAQQQQLLRTDKLASLGELVACVAHEINNPNHAVAMNLQFLREGIPRLFALADREGSLDGAVRIAGKSYDEFKSSCEKAIGDIDASSKRIDHIVAELKRFVRGKSAGREPPEKREAVDANSVVRNVLDLSRHMIRKSTDRFTLKLADPLPAVMADFVALEQVVLNLVENACQSLRDSSGSVEVATRYDRSAGDVCISVADEGKGIPEQDRPRIAEPFFTTKAENGGSGLGLSIVSRIVRDYGGSVAIDSEVGVGTTVTVRLPAAKR